MFRASLQKYSISSGRVRKAPSFTAASVALAATLTVAASTARAATFVVNSLLDAQDTTPGDSSCSTSSGDCTLRAAIQEANALAGPDTVLVPVAGVIKLTIPGPGEDAAATGDLDITEDLDIVGSLPSQTIIDGNGLDRIFEVRPGVTASISNLTIRKGRNLVDQGGGIASHGASLTLRLVIVEKNSAAGDGGGIFNDTGSLFLNDCIIRKNSSVFGNGGGISTNSGAILGGGDIVAKNKAGNYGGGIISTGGKITLYISLIEKNSGQGNGGGIRAGGDLTLNSVVVQKNKAANPAGGAGGGIAASGTTTLDLVAIVKNSTAAIFGGLGGGIYAGNPLTITRSIVEKNKAADKGGGIYVPAGNTATVENVTIAQNSAINGGGGVSNVGTATLSNVTMADNKAPLGAAIQGMGAASTTVENSIVKGTNNCDVAVATMGYNLDSANTCGFGGINDLPNTNPLLAPLNVAWPGFEPLFGTSAWHRVYALSFGSPAIDAGDNATCATLDALGVSRPVDGDGDGVADCDLGALEMN